MATAPAELRGGGGGIPVRADSHSLNGTGVTLGFPAAEPSSPGQKERLFDPSLFLLGFFFRFVSEGTMSRYLFTNVLSSRASTPARFFLSFFLYYFFLSFFPFIIFPFFSRVPTTN